MPRYKGIPTLTKICAWRGLQVGRWGGFIEDRPPRLPEHIFKTADPRQKYCTLKHKQAADSAKNREKKYAKRDAEKEALRYKPREVIPVVEVKAMQKAFEPAPAPVAVDKIPDRMMSGYQDYTFVSAEPDEEPWEVL